MKRALKIIFTIEVLLGTLWTGIAAMAQGAGGLAAVFWFLVIYALFAVFMLVAAWAFWKHPEQRKLAGWIMVLPIVFWFLPMLVRSLAGGVLTTKQLSSIAGAVLIAAVAGCWLFPRKAATILPRMLVRSRLFNWLILLAVVGGWAFLVAVIAYLVNGSSSSSSSGDMGLAYGIVLGAIYLVWLGAASFGASTWAWVSLRGGVETPTRRLNIAQVIVAMPGVLIGILAISWLASQMN